MLHAESLLNFPLPNFPVYLYSFVFMVRNKHNSHNRTQPTDREERDRTKKN